MATTDYQLDFIDRQAFEEDMRNMPEAPLTEADLDKMYTDAMKDEDKLREQITECLKGECEGCLIDTLESHTHRDGPWEDETEEIA